MKKWKCQQHYNVCTWILQVIFPTNMIAAEGVLSAAAAVSTPHPLIHYFKLHPYLIEFIQQVKIN